jgi:purine-binding chemotaxis protein CheW
MTIVELNPTEGLVSVTVSGERFGIPVASVQDVVGPVRIDVVPRAPDEVAGTLNLRGRIVTAIDMSRRIGVPRTDDRPRMSVIIDHGGELYALLVDDVGDVLWLPGAKREPPPATLSAQWRALCNGLYRLDDGLLMVMAVDRVLNLEPS